MTGLRSPKQYLPQLESLRGWAIWCASTHLASQTAKPAQTDYPAMRLCGYASLARVILV